MSLSTTMAPKTPRVLGCARHPYRLFFTAFWGGLTLLLAWFFAGRQDPLLLLIAIASVLAAALSLSAARCVGVSGGAVWSERRPFGRLFRRAWPLDQIESVSWEPNRAYDDQIQTRPMEFAVIIHLDDGRARPVLSCYREEEAERVAAAVRSLLGQEKT